MNMKTFDVYDAPCNRSKNEEVKKIAKIGVDATKKYIYNMVKTEKENSILCHPE